MMSYRMKIDRKSLNSARFISLLQRKIQDTLAASGMTQQEVADKLGVDRSVINRRLSGKANLTARSMAEFAYAFDKDLVVEYKDNTKAENVNWHSTTTIRDYSLEEDINAERPRTKSSTLEIFQQAM